MDDRGDFQQAMLQAGQSWPAHHNNAYLSRLEAINQKLRGRIDRLVGWIWMLVTIVGALALVIASYLLGRFVFG